MTLRAWAPLGFGSALEGALRDLSQGNAVSASALAMPARASRVEGFSVQSIVKAYYAAWQHPTCFPHSAPSPPQVLEQGLRLRFAALNGCPAVARAEVGVYYVTLDGFGQQRKHLLLLQERLPRGPLEEQEEEEEAGAEAGAAAGEGEGGQAGEQATVPNALVAHLGPGLWALLQDL